MIDLDVDRLSGGLLPPHRLIRFSIPARLTFNGA